KFFEKWNRNALADPRVRVLNEDARAVLKLSGKKYDVVINEPSNPWTVGVGSVFSREYYELAASHLKDDGIVAQWFHMYEMNDEIVSMVFRTFNLVFPYVEIWDPGSGDVILLGAMRPWKSTLEVYGQIFAREEVRKDLERIALKTPEMFWARQLASQRTAFAIPTPGGIQSDGFPVLEYEAPKAFYIGANSQVLMQFDERTWQSDLAPAPKKAALANLDAAQLRKTFEEYSSVNPQLVQCLFAKGSGLTEAGQSGGLPMPFIFRSPNAPASTATVAENASKELKTLIEAERALRANPAQWRESVAAVEGVL